ncbi:MAG TPA: hypothetical protein DHU55_13660 [Blastocatellia bacterium]|jgi:hypothetical protein|nr:hypothetical protein [Blastocatellia bacterium]HCX30792.1 hypothetical protein [Blastocatellia bacterium]
MKQIKRIDLLLSFCTSGLLLLMALPAYGDIARPKPSPEKPKIALHTSLVVVPDVKAYEARLQISETSLRELRAALANTPTNESMVQRVVHSSTRTAMAGLFLFLSLSFAGVWLARSMQTRGQKAAAALLLGIAVIGAAAIITRANAGPPSYLYWRKLPQNLSKGYPTSGSVDIEIVPDPQDGSGMKLIVPMIPER